ncbi:MAG: tRNA/rRNA methyltransferase (SpoU) [uncultured bacterium (gcode 4)]|uniref:tRNA/rRNA methyltransferase (SpoU) n=1 Tax=uncultured bacterium (gcode 4) TaxID=1234023 RepID=K2G6K8_9BACT|nr:MAG: tRNA/rRNA methyltransferase (SpoU) [uncultured bacterium (gcode 4)]
MKNNKYVLLDSIRSCLNVWAIMRTCDWAGFNKIILTWFTPTPPRKDISKTAIWAEEYVDWEYYDDPVGIINELKNSWFKIIVLEQSEKSIDIRELGKIGWNICIVLWNEIEWVNRKIIDLADIAVEIPMMWKKQSLNVATSAGILMYKFV